MSGSIRVFAPASIGNVGCGFDVLGLCLENPGDEIEAWRVNEPGVFIEEITGDEGKLSLDPSQNTAGIAIQAFLKETGITEGVKFRLHKKMPFGSGLGSSAASAVAGAFAANVLFDNPLARKQLLPIALEGEKFASGSLHADNVAPALLGGLILARGTAPFDVVEISTPKALRIVLVYPHVSINTCDARGVIPQNIPLRKAIAQWGNTAGLVAGMMQNDFGLIGRSLEDVIVEPHRSGFIPAFAELKKAAMQAGALGFSISGSGPTCFALTYNKFTADAIANAFQSTLNKAGITHTIYHSFVNKTGPKILSS